MGDLFFSLVNLSRHWKHERRGSIEIGEPKIPEPF